MTNEEKETFLILRGWEDLGTIPNFIRAWKLVDDLSLLAHWEEDSLAGGYLSCIWSSEEAIEYENGERYGEWVKI
jgi:hypothetical protein